MKWKLSLPEPQILLYYYAKLIGLAPFTVKKNKFYLPTRLGKLYPVSTAVIYFVFASISLFTITKKNSVKNIPRFAQFAISVGHLMSFLIALVTPIIFVIMCKDIVYIMNKLRFISNELKSFGVEEDERKIFKTLLVKTVMANTAIIAASVMSGFMESDWPIISSIKYSIDNLFHINAVLIFTRVLLFIQQRFKLVNEILYNIFKPVSLQNSQMFVVIANTREETEPRIEDLTDVERIQNIELLHLELCDLVYRTTHLFAFPILFKCFHSYIGLVIYSYWLYSVIQSFNQLKNNVEIVMIMMNLLNCFLKTGILICQLFPIAYTSVTTCREGNATKTVLSSVWHKPNLQELDHELFMFSLQLHHKRVAISAFGFLDLDYSLLYKIFCTAIASTIVFVQFEMLQ